MAIHIIEGQYSGEGKKFGLVMGRFNELITKRLMEGAIDCLLRHGVAESDITGVWVPGSFEIPLVAKQMAKSGKYDAIICVGAVIRGATPHFDFIASEVTKGIATTALQFDIPVTYGVITTDTIEQAIERAGTKVGNKGWDAALTALEMVNLMERLTV
ncbi:MAG: 6,7-dimethyl-8-ribityllumazine synthase [Gemmatimonadetes bacterium]|nr:MAG: 6,7-dimethyl-8-ribityllumazine synthase [Gemmatimonadota bacterium]